jgi:molybdopterin-guanine dinucleotide biosynthesis protein A
MQTPTDIRAAILAGGASRRMGTNKALLRLQRDGPCLIEMVVARLAEAGLSAPMLVTNSPHEYAFLGLESVPDDIEGAGTLGGVLTALNHAQTGRVLVVACDMPWLDPDLLRYMLSRPGQYDALVPKWSDHGQTRVEPLHAIYSQSSIAPIEQQIKSGNLKASALLHHINVSYLTEAEIREYDPQMKSFFNVNTPQQWQQAKK